MQFAHLRQDGFAFAIFPVHLAATGGTGGPGHRRRGGLVLQSEFRRGLAQLLAKAQRRLLDLA
jgi:hypothetical protein